MRTKSSKTDLSQKERIEMACARAGTLRDKIETARRSANEVRALARGLKSELRETIKLLNAIRRQMEDMAVKETYPKQGLELKSPTGDPKC
jgi:uncharacterized coiled-coil DUF342 family protein